MKTLLHLTRWHLRRDWCLALALFGLTLVSLVILPLDLDWKVMSPWVLFSTVLYLGLSALFVTRLVHSQPHMNDDSFWRTRPISRHVQVLAQYVSCSLVVALPVLLTFVVQAIVMDGSWQGVWTISGFLFWQMTVIFVATVLTKNAFAAATLIIAQLLIWVVSMNWLESRDTQSLNIDFGTFVLSLSIVAMLVLALAMTRRRYTWSTKLCFLASALVIPLLGFTVKPLDQNDSRKNRAHEVDYSVGKAGSVSQCSDSRIGDTYIRSLSEDVFSVPLRGSVRSGAHRYSYEFREDWQGISQLRGPFMDRILAALPEGGTLFCQSNHHGLQQRPYKSYLFHDGRDLHEWPDEMRIDADVTGRITHETHEFVHLPLADLKVGSSSRVNGFSAEISGVRRQGNQQIIDLMVSELASKIGPPSRRIFALVLYCPETGEGLIEHKDSYMYRAKSLILRSNTLTFSIADVAAIAPEGQVVECHLFTSRLLGESTSDMPVQAGVYDVRQSTSAESDEFYSVGKVSAGDFETRFIQSLKIAPDNYGYKWRDGRRNALRQLNQEQWLSLMGALEKESISFSVLAQVIDKKPPFEIETFFDYAEKAPALFTALRFYSHQEKERIVERAVELLQQASTAEVPLHHELLEVAAWSKDEGLAEAFLTQFQLADRDNWRVHNYLVKTIPQTEIKAIVLEKWRQQQAGYHHSASFAELASHYGDQRAFISLVESMENVEWTHRFKSWSFRCVKEQIALTEDQATWPNATLASWISREAGRFSYDKVTKKWYLK